MSDSPVPAHEARQLQSTHAPEPRTLPQQRPLTDLAAHLLAQRLHVLGQPPRIKLIDRLAIQATTVQELVDALGTTQQNISQHLRILRSAGIVARHKEGTRVRYQLADPDLLPILERIEASLAHEIDATQT